MTDSELTKACSKCGEVKPYSEFPEHPECKGGRHSRCNACATANSKKWREANLERVREADRRRYAENKARRDATKERARAHYTDNREAHLAYKKQYYKDNPEIYERARAKRMAFERGAEHQPYSRREIYDRDGGTCKGCGKALDYKPHGFEIDHIVPISLGGPDTPANVQLMCQPCNRKKWATLEGQLYFAL